MTQISKPVITVSLYNGNTEYLIETITPSTADYSGVIWMRTYRSTDGGVNYSLIASAPAPDLIDSTITPASGIYYRVQWYSLGGLYTDSPLSDPFQAPTPNTYTISPTLKNFGNLNFNSTEPYQTITITNNSSSSKTFNISSGTYFYSNKASTTIAGNGATDTFRIYARTNTIGSHNENITVSQASLGNKNVQCFSNIVNNPYSYSITPTTINFGNLSFGSSEPSQLLSIENTGSEVLSITFTNSNNFYFSETGVTIGIGQTSGVTVYAETNNLGSHSETLVINEPNAGNTNLDVESIINSYSPENPITTGLVAEYGDEVNGGTDLFTLANNTEITQWDDISGNENHLTGNNSNRPRVNKYASQYAFGGIQTSGGEYFQASAGTITFDGNKTIFYVGSKSQTVSDNPIFETSTGQDGIIRSSGGTGEEFYFYDNTVSPTENRTFNCSIRSDRRAIITLALSGGSNVVGRCNKELAFSATTNSSGHTSLDKVLNGEFISNAFLIYNRRLSDTEIKLVEDYLSIKYNTRRSPVIDSLVAHFDDVVNDGDYLYDLTTGTTISRWDNVINLDTANSTDATVLDNEKAPDYNTSLTGFGGIRFGNIPTNAFGYGAFQQLSVPLTSNNNQTIFYLGSRLTFEGLGSDRQMYQISGDVIRLRSDDNNPYFRLEGDGNYYQYTDNIPSTVQSLINFNIESGVNVQGKYNGEEVFLTGFTGTASTTITQIGLASSSYNSIGNGWMFFDRSLSHKETLEIENFYALSYGIDTPRYTYSLSPSYLNFGVSVSGDTESSQVVTITNTGNQTLNLTFTDSTNYYFSTSGATILSGSSTNITVFAKTDSIGIHNEELLISDDNALDSIMYVDGEIEAIQYSYSLDPTSKDFGVLYSGDTESSQVVTITNTGNQNLSFTFTDSTNFYILPSGLTLNVGESSGITIYAKTDSIGVHNELVYIVEADAGNTGFTVESQVVSPTQCEITVTSGLTAWYEERVNNGQILYGLANSTNITQWDDKSGNGNHALVTLDASHSYPQYKSFPSFPLFGGIETIYGGGAYRLFNNVSIPQNSGDKTIFYVGSVNLQPQNVDLFETSTPLSRNGVLSSTFGGSQKMMYIDTNATTQVLNYESTAGSTQRVIVSLALDGNNTVLGKLNGLQKFSGSTDSVANSIITTLGGDERGGFYQYVMNAFLVYDRRLTNTEILEVEECLGLSYGIDVQRDFDFSSDDLNFGDVEYSVTGNTLSNTITNNNGISSLSISYENTSNFSISGLTNPFTLGTGDSSQFNVVYSTGYTTVGERTENIYFSTSAQTNLFRVNINVILFPPSDLIGVSYFSNVFLNWVDNTINANIDGFRIYRDGILIATTTNLNYVDETAIVGVNYNYQVVSYITGVGESDFSNTFNITAGSNILDGYCSLNTQYNISGETSCDSGDGIIQLVNYYIYSFFYNFTLTDVFGNSYGSPNSNGEFTGLSANYYFITVIPINNELRDNCTIDWIPLTDGDSYHVTGSTITPNICEGFNSQNGRVILTTNITGDSNYYLYKNNSNFIISGTTSSDIILQNLDTSIYYIIIESISDGCTILYSFFVSEESVFSTPNIEKIYIAEWSSSLDWNNWSTENDPDFYAPLDTLEFQSTKISEFTTTGLTWYSINVDPQNVNFTQSLDKVRQGFIFNDRLTIGIPYNDTSKWNALRTLFGTRWVVIFKDNNGFWWTFGYTNGAEAQDYSFGSDSGGFTLAFVAVSESKILTSIDESWVINNVV